ncbi:tetratricopeptide repeat protein [Kitasatospora purpeofusca]|uniref:tetratricopeptide repeat protein n=1 Tax=Kitasatospora purpeofusca TaxID=67352 RepID=UPI00224F2A6A|nr:tetratricopeptide repeat protein [Kitasatospora purpeofusca]MCX4683253.1 tetratricopeptide repeat protein [Kitasatospora purpeofusca]
MSGEQEQAGGAGSRVDNRLTGGTVHGHVVQAGRADITLRMSDPAAPAAVAVTVTPPLGLRDPGRPLRGREETLERLEAELAAEPGAEGRLLALCGMGGCGKTAIALEVAARRSAAGCRVWWVEARNGPALEAALRAVARQAGATQEELERDTADLLWSRLARLDTPWLLVVDNADDPALLDGPGSLSAGTGWIRPATGPGAVLVTTRDSTRATWGQVARLHLLRPLTGGRLDAAARILRDHAPASAGTADEAHALAARLGGLPLALRLAGTYLEQANRTPPSFRAPATPTTYTGYLRAWEDGLDRLDPGHALARTWAMSVALLEQRSHGHARALLELLAAFADADLPYTHLLTPDRLADSGPLAALDGPAIWQHLTALAALGLVELLDAAPDTPPVLRMHPLVRDASRTRGTEADAARLLIATALADDSGDPQDPQFWPLWRLLRPLILDAFQRADAAGLTEEALPGLSAAVNMAGCHLMAEGLNAQALAVFEAVLVVERELVGATHPNVLVTRHNRALVLRDLGESTQARAELEAVLAVKRERFGETHVQVLATRHELACLLYVEGDLAVARTELQEVLAALRRVLEDTAPQVLATRHELACVLGELGDLAAARAAFEEVLAVMRERQGTTHPAALATRYELARVLREQGELAQARAELEAVLAVERERLGDTHPSTLLTRYSLALVLRDQGESAQARAELEAVLAVETELLGPDHRDTQITRRSLDGVLRMLEGR